MPGSFASKLPLCPRCKLWITSYHCQVKAEALLSSRALHTTTSMLSRISATSYGETYCQRKYIYFSKPVDCFSHIGLPCPRLVDTGEQFLSCNITLVVRGFYRSGLLFVFTWFSINESEIYCIVKADGYLARRYNMQSVLGTILDPAADKTLMTTLTVTLSMNRLIPCLFRARTLSETI